MSGWSTGANGIPLSKIHHAAFDAHLIAIQSGLSASCPERLLGQEDGPMLEEKSALKSHTYCDRSLRGFWYRTQITRARSAVRLIPIDSRQNVLDYIQRPVNLLRVHSPLDHCLR